MQVIWLASYPKSGNTWLRIFLYSYLSGRLQRSNDLDQKIPDLHALDRNRGLSGYGDQVICKTHLLMNPRHPFLDKTRGFIHVLRHPKDVLLSNLNYARIGNDGMDGREFAEAFIAATGVPRWEQAGMGNWISHTTSWLDAAPHFPHLFLRFEQLKADPEVEFKRVLQFLGLPLDAEKLNLAIQWSALSSVKDLEEKERSAGYDSRIFYTRYASSATFINQGASGQSLEVLGEGLDESFDARFGAVLGSLGYPAE